jgi:hypothetical protein
VIAASLAVGQPETAARVRLAGAGAAEVDHRGLGPASAAVSPRRSFNEDPPGRRRWSTACSAPGVRPLTSTRRATRRPLPPRGRGCSSRLAVPIGTADRARPGRRRRVPTAESPVPGCRWPRSATRRWRDHPGRVRAEDRRVRAPGLGRGLVEDTAHRKEELGGFPHDLDERVRGEPEDEEGDHTDADLHHQREGAERAQHAPARRRPRPDAEAAWSGSRTNGACNVTQTEDLRPKPASRARTIAWARLLIASLPRMSDT